jgi:hypothetical protein
MLGTRVWRPHRLPQLEVVIFSSGHFLKAPKPEWVGISLPSRQRTTEGCRLHFRSAHDVRLRASCPAGSDVHYGTGERSVGFLKHIHHPLNFAGSWRVVRRTTRFLPLPISSYRYASTVEGYLPYRDLWCCLSKPWLDFAVRAVLHLKFETYPLERKQNTVACFAILET